MAFELKDAETVKYHAGFAVTCPCLTNYSMLESRPGHVIHYLMGIKAEKTDTHTRSNIFFTWAWARHRRRDWERMVIWDTPCATKEGTD